MNIAGVKCPKYIYICFYCFVNLFFLSRFTFVIILVFLNLYALAIESYISSIKTKLNFDNQDTDKSTAALTATESINDGIEVSTESKNIQAAGKLTTTQPKVRKEKSDPYECPNTSDFNFFPHYCSRHANCLQIDKEYRCCRQFNSKRCVKGVPKPLKEQRHERKYIDE